MLLAFVVFVLTWCACGRPPPYDLRPGPGLSPDATGPAPSGRSWAERPVLRSVSCTVAGLAVGIALGGGPGAPFGLVGGAVLAWWIGRWEPAHVARDRSRVERDLPMVADLLAACVRAGVPVEPALAHVAGTSDGPLADRLEELMARIELGADPLSQWRSLGADPVLGGLARALARAAESGAPPADSLDRFAADSRRLVRARQLERARAVGVRCAAPLALCFLPAFMLVGVVPTIVGAFADLPW